MLQADANWLNDSATFVLWLMDSAPSREPSKPSWARPPGCVATPPSSSRPSGAAGAPRRSGRPHQSNPLIAAYVLRGTRSYNGRVAMKHLQQPLRAQALARLPELLVAHCAQTDMNPGRSAPSRRTCSSERLYQACACTKHTHRGPNNHLHLAARQPGVLRGVPQPQRPAIQDLPMLQANSIASLTPRDEGGKASAASSTACSRSGERGTAAPSRAPTSRCARARRSGWVAAVQHRTSSPLSAQAAQGHAEPRLQPLRLGRTGSRRCRRRHDPMTYGVNGGMRGAFSVEAARSEMRQAAGSCSTGSPDRTGLRRRNGPARAAAAAAAAAHAMGIESDDESENGQNNQPSEDGKTQARRLGPDGVRRDGSGYGSGERIRAGRAAGGGRRAAGGKRDECSRV